MKFIGRLDDVWFRGDSPTPYEQKNEEEKARGLNPMVIDFSNADLWYITYSDDCNLSNVKMPEDGKHYLIYNFQKVIRFLEDDVEKISDMEGQKFQKEFIEMYKYHVVKQDMIIINIKEVISSAEYYLGQNAKSYCEKFLTKIITFSNS